MLNKNFVEFSISLLLKDKKEYIFSFVVFTFIIFIASSVLFISDSIKHDLLQALKQEHQVIVSNTKSGRYASLTDEHIDKIIQMNGIDDVLGKVDGYYNFAQSKRYFHIVVDDELDDKSMIVSSEIKELLEKFKYSKEFNFLSDSGMLTLEIKEVIPSNILSNDIVMVSDNSAREILNMDEDEYSYLDIVVPNDDEVEYIAVKVTSMFPDTQAITTKNIKSEYDHLFYYKGGIFMILYIVALVSFFILLKNQISSVSGEKKKEIAILRSLGFAIKDVIALKIVQNSVVSFSSFVIGIFLAYAYVFMFDAPLLKNIFVGNNVSHIEFTPIVNVGMLSLMFVFTVVPFMASILLPAWRIAIEEMDEVMK